MMNQTDLILHSVSTHVDELRNSLTPEQQRRFLQFWQPIANASDIAGFERAVKIFRSQFCGKISGLEKILPELNAPVTDKGHPAVIDPHPAQEPPTPLPFENRLILAKEVLRRFEQTPTDAEAAKQRHDEAPQASS